MGITRALDSARRSSKLAEVNTFVIDVFYIKTGDLLLCCLKFALYILPYKARK